MTPQFYETVLTRMLEQGRVSEVIGLSSSLLEQWLDWGAGWRLRGIALTVQGQYAMARSSLERAQRIGPLDAIGYNSLGVACRFLGDYRAAENCFRAATVLVPTFAEAFNNLGGALALCGRAEAALIAFGRAIEINPSYAEAYHGHGNSLLMQGRVREARQSFLAAFRCDSTRGGPLAMACHLAMQSFEWGDGLANDLAQLKVCIEQHGGGDVPPFLVAVLPGFEAEEQKAAAKSFAHRQYAGFLSDPPLVSRRARGKGSIRVGLLSSDFHEHATSYLLTGVLENLVGGALDVRLYSYGSSDDCAALRRIQATGLPFIDCSLLSHLQIAQRIAADCVDILVDLKGYTEGARPEVLALRPAPVQVNWLGYPGTMGERRLADYLIGDPIVTPLDQADFFSETLALLPHCYQPNDNQRQVSSRPNREDAGLPNSGFVFCSFNLAYKITPEVLCAWARILREAEDSVLWLLDPGEEARELLRSEFREKGGDPESIVFAPKLSQADHLARLGLADLSLDTFPCNSHTTASDSLWAGVPMLTRQGRVFASRVAASVLNAAGLPELVVQNWDEYVQLALALRHSPSRLADVRSKLLSNRQPCALFDTQRFAADLELLLSRIWEHHANGERGPLCPVSSRGREN